MAAWDFNPQITNQAPAFLAQGLAGLGQGVAQAIESRRQAAQDAENLQFENVKNQTIVKNLYDKKLVTPEQYYEFQNAPPKKQKALAEGYAASLTFNLMQEKNKPFTPTAGVVPNPIQGGAPISFFQSSKGSAQVLPQAAAPFRPGEPIDIGDGAKMYQTSPNGWTIRDNKGNEKLQLTPDEQQAVQAAGKIPLRQSNGSFVYADNPAMPKAKAGQKDTITQFAQDADSIQKLLDAGHIDESTKDRLLGDMNTRLKGLFNANGPKTSQTNATGPAGTMTDPNARVKVIDAQGRTGTIPASQLDDALRNGYKPAP